MVLKRPLLLPLIIFLVSFFSFTFSMRVFQTTDSYPNNITALNAIFNKRLDLTNLKSALKERGILSTVVINRDGKIYPKTPVIVGLLSIPTFVVLNQFYGVTHLTPEQIVVSDYSQYIGKISASFYVALSAVLLFLILKKLKDDTVSNILATAVYIFGTSVFNTASQANWQHGISLFLITVLIYLLLSSKRLIVIYICGLLTGLLFSIRVSNAFYGIFVLAYLYVQVPDKKLLLRSAAIYFFGIITSVAAIYALNRILVVPYGYQNELLTSLRVFTVAGFLKNMHAILFSFNYGLFFFSPVLILSWMYFFRFVGNKIRDNSDKKIFSFLPTLAIFIIFSSIWWMWTGGVSINARLLTESLPIWIILLNEVVFLYKKNFTFKAVFAVLFMASIFFNLLTTYGMDWTWYFKYTKPGYENQVRNAWFIKPSLIGYLLQGNNRIIYFLKFYKKDGIIYQDFENFRPSIKQGGIVKLSDEKKVLLDLSN